jgi:hypothetical protein
MSPGLVTFIGDNRRARRSKSISGIPGPSAGPGSDRRAPSQNLQQRWHTSHGEGVQDRFSGWAALG